MTTGLECDDMTEADVRDALREVIDPELGVNIVDLGLVYGVDVDGRAVRITMTMTSPACPLRDYLQDLVESAVTSRVPDAQKISIEIVTDPPWTEDLMSEAARRQLE
jgi:metal-sulfur cluster biosynthetic enzyme